MYRDREYSRYDEDNIDELCEELACERGRDAAELARELFRRGYDEEEIRDRLDY